MNEASLKSGPSAPEDRKILDQCINNANAKIYGLEGYEKELSVLTDRLIRVGMNLNEKDHPLNQAVCDDHMALKAEIEVDNENKMSGPAGLTGRIVDLGDYADEISRKINKQLHAMRNALEYVERHI